MLSFARKALIIASTLFALSSCVQPSGNHRKFTDLQVYYNLSVQSNLVVCNVIITSVSAPSGGLTLDSNDLVTCDGQATSFLSGTYYNVLSPDYTKTYPVVLIYAGESILVATPTLGNPTGQVVIKSGRLSEKYGQTKR